MADATAPSSEAVLARALVTAPCPDADALVDADSGLRAAAKTLRGALGHFDATEHEAWANYARAVDRALVHLEAELDVAAVQLGVHQATSPDDLTAALHRAGDQWRALNDELRVRAHLGEMEARDLYDRAGTDLAHAATGIQATIVHLGHQAGEGLDELRHDAAAAIDRLREALFSLRLVAQSVDGPDDET